MNPNPNPNANPDRYACPDVCVAAEYLWTSAKTHAVVKYMPLCSVINAGAYCIYIYMYILYLLYISYRIVHIY